MNPSLQVQLISETLDTDPHLSDSVRQEIIGKANELSETSEKSINEQLEHLSKVIVNLTALHHWARSRKNAAKYESECAISRIAADIRVSWPTSWGRVSEAGITRHVENHPEVIESQNTQRQQEAVEYLVRDLLTAASARIEVTKEISINYRNETKHPADQI